VNLPFCDAPCPRRAAGGGEKRSKFDQSEAGNQRVGRKIAAGPGAPFFTARVARFAPSIASRSRTKGATSSGACLRSLSYLLEDRVLLNGAKTVVFPG